MSVGGFPIDVADGGAVGVRATGALAALQAFEPLVQLGVLCRIFPIDVARVPELRHQRRQQYRASDSQWRFPAMCASERKDFCKVDSCKGLGWVRATSLTRLVGAG